MTQMSPEDRDLDKLSAQVSERYRADAHEEPPPLLNAAIRQAARLEVERPRQRPAWQMPVSIAATLVVGIAVALLVRDNEPPLSSLDRSAPAEAMLAKPVPRQLAVPEQPKTLANLKREDSLTRERSARPDSESAVRNEARATQVAPVREIAASGVSAPPVPAASPVVGSATSTEPDRSRLADANEVSPGRKAGTLKELASESLSAAALRKQGVASGPVQPEDVLRRVDELLREGKDAEAKQELRRFRVQFPQYRLPERLLGLLPAEQR